MFLRDTASLVEQVDESYHRVAGLRGDLQNAFGLILRGRAGVSKPAEERAFRRAWSHREKS